MWIVIGVLLIIYTAVVLVILYRWWKAIVAFVREILTDADSAVQGAQDVLPPIQRVADDARRVAVSIRGVGDEINREIPPALQTIAGTIGDLDAAITTFQTDAGRQLDDLGNTLREAVGNVAGMVRHQAQTVLPDIVGHLRATSAMLDELEWYRLTAAVVADLNANHGVPTAVTDKLADLLDVLFADRATFEQAVQARLTAAEFTAHHTVIADGSRNPAFENDLAALILDLAATVNQIGTRTLPDAADSLEDLAPAWVALVTLLVGPHTPLAVITVHVTNVLLLLKQVMEPVNLRINRGQWLDTHLTLPHIDLNVPVVTVPAGLISYDWSTRVAGRWRIGFDFSLPGGDFSANLAVARRGDWFDGRFRVPPQDIELFNGHGLADAIEDIRARAEAIRDTVLDATQTQAKFVQAAASMRRSGTNLARLATDKLPGQATRLRETAGRLLVSADTLDQTVADWTTRADEFDRQAGTLVAAVLRFKDGLLATLNSASRTAATATQAINDIDLGPTVGHLHRGADALADAGNRIDDGTPVGTPGKSDFVQKFHDVLDRVRRIIPSLTAARSVIDPIFYILFALHVGLLLLGIWLVVRGAA